ncbi:hypothetical protein [Leucobacter muris]|uniref:hypothetical protein n=1 Tax=Leucobacter muris TaxID=1935379 RepID=UPI0026B705C8|nr:hypothetical protein [Leucobacter muris]
MVSVKRTGDVFVAIDGGLADNLDIALTAQRYEALLADRIDEPWTETVQLVGRQCESGDLFIDGAPMPAARVGDLVVMPGTGAYNYTLANNYNGALKPAIVLVRDGGPASSPDARPTTTCCACTSRCSARATDAGRGVRRALRPPSSSNDEGPP